MKIKEIGKKAKALGINSFGKKKVELIREIQRTEGNIGCYAKAHSGTCDRKDCLWYRDCMAESKSGEAR